VEHQEGIGKVETMKENEKELLSPKGAIDVSERISPTQVLPLISIGFKYHF
jgi:hypothetical protein